jgi:hypothetical protein
MKTLLLYLLIALDLYAIPKTETKEFPIKSIRNTTNNNDTLKVEKTAETVLPVNSNDKGKIVLITQEKKDDGFFKTIFPVLTLILGIFINRILDYFTKRNRIKQAGQRWIGELGALEVPITEQIKNLQSFIEKLKLKDFCIPDLELHASIECKVFKTLDKGELIQYLAQKKKLSYKDSISISSEIFVLISEIEFLHNSIIKTQQDAIIEQSNYHDKLEGEESLFKDAMIEYEIFMKKSNIDISTIEPYKTFYITNKKRLEEKELDMEYSYLLDLYKTTVNKFQEFKHEQETAKVRLHADKCHMLVHRLKHLKTELLSTSDITILECQEKLSELQRLIKKL